MVMYRKTRLGALFSALLVPLLAVSLAGAPAAAAPERATVDPAAADAAAGRWGPQLQQLLEAVHTAGMPGVFAEVRDGTRTWAGAAGVADVDTGRPVRPWFMHRVGSITKSFVATTILQLVGEHRVRLDAPIGDYLPGLLPDPLGRQVTVRMLLQHTSGIGNYTDPIRTYEDIEALRDRTATPLELVAIGLSLPAAFPPGTGWSYSNTNYIIAGLLVERITGRPVADEVGRRILRPLGMRGTYFPGNDPIIRGPHANAYVPWSDGTLRDFSAMNMSWAWAAGALISTPQDLDTFYRALLTGRRCPRRCWPRCAARCRWTRSADHWLFQVPTPCGPVWGHTGGVIGQTTASYHSPDGSRQVTLAENMIFMEPSEQQNAVAEAENRFLAVALCGPEAVATPAATAATTATAPVDTARGAAGPVTMVTSPRLALSMASPVGGR
jgi:D-alanyl-D-alanine carboxypeptidase